MSEQPPPITPHALRERLHQLVAADLLGPANGPAELVNERNVRGRYIVGLLAPQGQSPLPMDDLDSDEGLTAETTDGALESAGSAGDEESSVEGRASQVRVSMLPSAIGLTFTVDGAAQAIQVTARWGHYTLEESKQEEEGKEEGTLKRLWQRTQRGSTSPPIPLEEGRWPDVWRPEPTAQPKVYVEGLVRRASPGPNGEPSDHWTVTLFLVNGQKEGKPKDEFWLFQPEVVVESPDGRAIFRRRPNPVDANNPEQQNLAMLYRNHVEFAVGHGVAVHAELAPDRVDRAVRLQSRVLPFYDVPMTTQPTGEELPLLAGLTLDMKTLGNLEMGHFGSRLAALPTAYRAWIDDLKSRVAEPDLLPHQVTAQAAIEHCESTLARIQEGIALLDSNPQAAAAFAFANRAMQLQRVHSIYAGQVRRGESADYAQIEGKTANFTWRIFQLAFLLLNLPGLTDLHHPDREQAADLLWFPTGGGKTEAYLGVAAYTMALRRLQGEVGGRSGQAGVAVLMRYTLRLLTLQQFQRAATLICACERIRRQNPEIWGGEPFRIGLWVGRNTTPNWTEDAAEAVKQLRNKGYPGGRGGSPDQLTNCPWCGAELQGGRDIVVESGESGRGRTFLFCPNGGCPFSQRHAPEEGIPVLLVDEEIYRRLPSLLIATVDKFAQMPWNGRVGMLFGQVDGYCERHGYRSPEIADSDSHRASPRHRLPAARTIPAGPLRPPDLIIQDELHLISGPLGTLVGLYETAVDGLASWQVDGRTVRPKVIASTATVRQAGRQMQSLFTRDVRIFPPNGLEIDDNFFSRQRQPSETFPGRRYLGICAPGILHKTALIQTYTSFLAAAQLLYSEYGREADPWMTLVGYFNALRELGSMRRAAEDSVSARLRRMDSRGLGRRFLSTFGVEELTSRLGATDIPKILDKLEIVFDPLVEEERKRTKDKTLPWPIDVVLATNMISVGVDVDRLGLMVVAGQPKNTAEYIQATSRVGRRFPGLVATVFNWTRPRDLSHYERFEHYHATFYQHVEALSVTPFSQGAVQRGLSALLVSFVRQLGQEFNANERAGRIDLSHPHILTALESIRERAALVAGLPVAQAVEEDLRVRLDKWLDRAQLQGAVLGYKEARPRTVALLSAPDGGNWDTFACLNSLRNVEPTSNLILDDFGMDRQHRQPWTFAETESRAQEGSGD